MKINHFGPFFSKNLFGYIWKNPQLASPGKNPSDAHVAATGTIMRFVGATARLITIINLHNRLSAEFQSRYFSIKHCHVH